MNATLNPKEFMPMSKTRREKAPSRRGHIIIDRELCKGCALCIYACPRQVIGISDSLNEKGYYPAAFIETPDSHNNGRCTACGFCAITCPDVAIEVYRD